MKINNFVMQIGKDGYNIENVLKSQIYKKIKDDDVKIAIYSRISKEKDNDISVERQNSQMIRFLTKLGLKIDDIKVYVDEGISGTNPDRPAYVSLINDALANKINIVLSVRIDRLGRSFYYIYNTLYEIFYKSSTLFLSLSNKLINTEDETLEILEEALVAEKYARKVSRDVKEALRERMEDGNYIGGGLYGYKVFEQEFINDTGFKQKKRTLIINNDGIADVVRKIFLLYLSGLGYERIATQLENENIISPTGEKVWWGNTIKMILENPLYCGILAQGRYRKPSYLNKRIIRNDKCDWITSTEFQGIVSKEIFDEVQKQMKVRRERYRYKTDKPHLLASLMRCAECGKTLVYKGKGNYKCLGSQDGSGCSTHLIKENEMLEVIHKKLKRFNIDKEGLVNRLSENYERINNINRIDKLIDNNDKEINNFRKKIVDAHSQKCDDNLDEETYQYIVEQYQRTIKNLISQSEELKKKKTILPIVRRKFEELIERYKKFELVDNAVLRLLIKEIKVFQINKVEIVWNIKNN